jgi:small GTP-binding protein
MGGYCSRIFDALFETKSSTILMIGLQGAGKSKILHQLTDDEIIEVNPWVGFSFEKVSHKQWVFKAWDLGKASESLELLELRLFKSAEGVIFVLDATDREKIDEARVELQRVLGSKSLKEKCKLLVFANKSDLPASMTSAEIIDRLGLGNLQEREWLLQQVCGLTGEGVHEGLYWLTANNKKDKEKKE